MGEIKTGLHKKVSSIFDGVTIPPKNSTTQSGGAEKSYRQNGSTAKDGIAAMLKSVMPTDVTKLIERLKTKLLEPKPGVSRKRQATMAMLVPTLVVVLFVVLIKNYHPSPDAAVASNVIVSKTVTHSDNTNTIDWQFPRLSPENMRHPMQIGRSSVASAGLMVVKGIVYSEQAPSAIIGNQIVTVGDEIFGATVLKIDRNSVTFKKGSKKWTQQVQ